MANFVEALGRSQAITSAISGIQGIQQGELAIKNQESQQAINEYNLKKIQEEEAAGERLLPIDPAFGRLTPSVKDFWGKIAQPYMVKGTSGENYIKAKDMPRLMQTMEQDKAFRLHTYKLTLTDTMTMQQKLNKLLEQAKSGEGETKMNDKQIAELQADMAKVNQQKYYLDNIIAMHEGRKAKEDFTLNQGEKRFSGTGEQIATGGEKPPTLPYKIGERQKFTGKDGKSYEGTFKGLTEKNEPIFENVSEAITKPIVTELNPYQKFSAGHQLRSEIKSNPYIKGYQEVSTKYSVMQKALKESQTSKNLIAVDQALITLFNKMTDPESVVRESEYARTPQDMAMYNRIQGKIDKLRSGGAGLTPDERNALVRMGQNFMEVYQGNYDQTISDYEKLAKESGLDPKVIGIPYERKKTSTHPLTGKPSGRYKINGKEIKWDGTKEIP